MGPPTESKRAKPTPADLAAAARLRAIHERTSAAKRPTQQEIADRLEVSQGAVSHYFRGRMRLTFNAVVIFAELYNCRPEEIRDDLPEMQAARSFVSSAGISSDPDEKALDAVWASYSLEKKKKLIGMGKLAQEMAAIAEPAIGQRTKRAGRQ